MALIFTLLCACAEDAATHEAPRRGDSVQDAAANASDARTPGPAGDVPDRRDAATPDDRDSTLPDASSADAGANDAAGTTGSSAPTPALAHPTSEYCGDAIRDPVLEECDDGDGIDPDPCSEDCRVRSTSLLPLSDDETDAGTGDEPDRTLGTGPHVASGLEHGFAAAYAETATGAGSSVWLQAHDEHGGRLGLPFEVSAGETPIDAPNPVIAALPNDRYAVAWTDGASGTPDVRLRLWDAVSGELGEARTAHDGTGGFQQDADILWTGEQLIVAFTDLLDVRYRAFSADLRPLGPPRALATSSTAIESSVTLARFGSGWAAALRANEDALERIEVIAGSLSWSTPLEQAGPSGDRPALIALDEEHLLLLFTVGTDPLGTGSPSVGQLRVAVLSASSPGPVATSAFAPLLEPYAGDVTLAQRRPSIARAGERVYVAWESASPAGDERGAEVFVAQLEFDPVAEVLVQHQELALPLDAARDGAQSNPRVSGSELFPEGALITLWEDAAVGERVRGAEILLDFRPSPFVRLDPASTW